MENISAQLRLAELKKTNISKEIEHIQSQATSMLLFSRQGKELTDRLDSLYDSVLQRFQELESREKHLESKEKELDSMQRAISQRSISLDLAEKSLEERRRKVQLEEDNLVNRKRLIEKRASEAKSELEQTFLVSLRKSIKESGDEVEKSLQKVQEAVQEYELLRRKVEERSQEVEAEEKRLDSIRKWTVERFSELKSKEKQFNSLQKPMEEGVEKPIENGVDSPFASLQFSVTMDGPSLQIFLNKCPNEHELMRHDISFALRRSLDPAEVVLDAMQGFYPPHLKDGDVEFEANVARKSCVFLLEQLMEVLPQIRPRVKQAAMKVAAEWKMKMRTGAENLIEVLGFLQLLAAYGLASSFNAEELLQLIATVGQHRQASQLCNALGLKEAIPNLVSCSIRSQVKIDQSPSEHVQLNNTVVSSSVGSWPELKPFCINLDGNGLRLFLSKRVNEHHAMHSELFDALLCTEDPVKLVFDAMRGFHSQRSDGVECFKLGGNRMGCSFLLDQLMRLSPQITTHAKEEAMKIAVDWKGKLREKNEDPLKVLVFLQFLVTFGFGLASSFEADELLGLLKIVYWHKQAPDLLSLTNRIPCQSFCSRPNSSLLLSSLPSRLLDWSNEISLREKKAFRKTFGNLLPLLEVHVHPPLLEALLCFWDSESICFRFGEFELVPTLEEFSQLLGVRFDTDSLVQPSFKPSKMSLRQFLGLKEKTCRLPRDMMKESETFSGCSIDFLCKYFGSLHFFNQNKDLFEDGMNLDLWWKHRLNALAFVVLGSVIFPREPGFADMLLYPLVKQMESGCSIVSMILTEVIRALSHCSSGCQDNFFGCAALLQVWFLEHLKEYRSKCVGENENFLLDDLVDHIVDPSRLATREAWIGYIKSLSFSKLVWKPSWFRVGGKGGREIVMRCKGHHFVPLIGLRGLASYSPCRVMRQFGLIQVVPNVEDMGPWFIDFKKDEWNENNVNKAMVLWRRREYWKEEVRMGMEMEMEMEMGSIATREYCLWLKTSCYQTPLYFDFMNNLRLTHERLYGMWENARTKRDRKWASWRQTSPRVEKTRVRDGDMFPGTIVCKRPRGF